MESTSTECFNLLFDEDDIEVEYGIIKDPGDGLEPLDKKNRCCEEEEEVQNIH